MRILITGSEGTLGRPLVKELERRGHEVYGFDLKHSRDPNVYRCNIQEYRQLKIRYEEIFTQLKRCDIVYHLGAEFGRINGEEYYEEVWKTNAIGTRNILELQREKGFRLIFASSSEIYGEIRSKYLTEAMSPVMQSNDYAISKWVNEIQCKNARERYGSRIMVLRFFNAYGPGEYYNEYRSVCSLFCYKALHGIYFNVFKNYHRVFMYIDDFIPTLANASENFIDGETINIGGQEYRSVEDLSDIVIKCTKADPRLAVLLDEDKHNVVNKRPDISKAINLLKHNPKTRLEEGIKKTVAWMREVYSI